MIRFKVALLFSWMFPVVFLYGSNSDDSIRSGIGSYAVVELKDDRSAGEMLMMARKIEETDPMRSEFLARKVRLFALSTGNQSLRIEAQLQIATLLINSTRYTEAMKVAMQVKELAENLEGRYQLAIYHEIVGKIRTYTGDYSESLENLYLALDYFDKLKDFNGRSRVLNSVGVVYFRQGEVEKAMQYYIRAYAISILNRDTAMQARVMNNMGGVLIERKDFRNAQTKLSQALDLYLGSRMFLKAGVIQMNLGNLFLQNGKYALSLDYFLKALAVFTQFENYLHMALCYNNLADYYSEAGAPEKCLGSLQKAYGIADKYGFKGVKFQTVTQLQDFFVKDHKIDSAFHYAVLKAGVKNSLDQEKSTYHLSIAEMQYQQEKKNDAQIIIHQRQNLVTSIAGLTLVSLVIIAFLVISRQRQKAKVINLEKKGLTDELEFKNRELTLHVMNLLKRNEVIIDTSRRLLEIRVDHPADSIKDEIIKIAKSLKDETDREIWDEFELRFKQVHSGFYERLLGRYPDLTPNELKMCGLLRLNLTTKEISELTGQRRETIDMARFRLRKHLELNDPQVNLVTFLSKI